MNGKIEKYVILVACIIVFGLVALAVTGVPLRGSSGPTGSAVAALPSGSVQNVGLSFQNYEYILSPSTLKVGVPVRMEVDLATVSGCMTTVVIPAFNVQKTVGAGDNIITFTPDKVGTFGITCSMNMGRGTFTVV
jgi:uncharacterized protein